MVDILQALWPDLFSGSVLVSLLLAAIYFFGKMQVDIKPKRETTFAIYLEGLLFAAYMLVLPFLIVWSIENSSIIPDDIGIWPAIFLILSQTAIVILLRPKVGAIVLAQTGLENFFKSKLKSAVDKHPILNFGFFKEHPEIVEYGRIKTEQTFLTKTGPIKIFLYSTISILLTWTIIFNQQNIPLKVISGLVEFWIISALALVYGFYTVTFEPVEVKIGRKTIKGVLVKDTGDRLKIKLGEKIFDINMQKIDYFSQNIFIKTKKKNIRTPIN